MSDPCIAEFNSRIARIEKAHAKGYGFEAAGTLGRSSYTRYRRKKNRKIRAVRPFVVVILCATLLKAMFLQQLGAQAYDDRVARLMQGEGFDRIGGWLMQADPLTVSFAGGIDTLFKSSG
jgi:hypothetical protein